MRLASLLSTVFLCNILLSQGTRLPFNFSGDIFGTHVFIENKGQFNGQLKSNKPVLFALIQDEEQVYFTPDGPVIKHLKHHPQRQWATELEELGISMPDRKPSTFEVAQEFINHQSAEIIPSNPQSHYFSFGGPEFNSKTFKRITYKNMYPGIDIVYDIPANATQGLKYAIVVYPGADINALQFIYTGAVRSIQVNDSGALEIKTPLHNILDTRPVIYSQDAQYQAAFQFTKSKLLQFEIPHELNTAVTYTIDPFVSTVTTLTNSNIAFDVDYDNAGNVFIYGGSNPCKIAKYNSGGTLLWTFVCSLTSPSWNSSGFSNFVVMKSNGKCYTGQAVMTSGTRIIRIDANGNYDNFITPAFPLWREVWDMAYHCTTGNIYGMGGSTGSSQSAGIVDQTTASLTPISFFNCGTIAHDVVSHAIDDGGNFFWNYASVSSQCVNNYIARINSAFTSSVWIAPSTFTTLGEAAQKSGILGSGGSGNGLNTLAVNANYLFYYDGLNLAAYSKLTGAIIASTTISGHIVKRQAGIAADDCDNIYIGAFGQILGYKFTGTSFLPIGTIPVVANTTTVSYVLDIRLDKFNKLLYASGGGFVGTYVAAFSNTCNIAPTLCYNTFPLQYTICAGSPVTITPVNYFNLTNPTFSVFPGNYSNQSGTFVITPTATTNYTTYVTGTTSLNTVATFTSLVQVTVVTQPTIVPQYTMATCTNTNNAFNLNLTFIPAASVTPNYTISWSTIPNGILSPTQFSATGVNSGAYTATITAEGGCTQVASFTLQLPQPADFTIQPTPLLLNCYQPSITLTLTPSNLNYTLTNGTTFNQNTTTPVLTFSNATGVFTCTSKNPISNCTKTQTFVISQSTVTPTSVISPSFQNITCTSVITPIQCQVNPTVNIQQLWLAPQGGSLVSSNAQYTFTPGSAGIYTHIALNTTNGCKTARTFTVSSNSGFPIFSVASPQNFSLGCGSTSVANIQFVNSQSSPPGSSITHTLIGPGTSTLVPNGPLNTANVFTVNAAGNWTLMVRDNTNGCTAKVYITVLSNTLAPQLDSVAMTFPILTCYNPQTTVQAFYPQNQMLPDWAMASPTVHVQSPTISVACIPTAPTQTLIGNFTLTLTDPSSTCKTTTVISILQNIIPPLATINGASLITCTQNSLVLTNGSSTKIPPYFNPNKPVVAQVWTGPPPQGTVQLSSTYTGFYPGTYTLLVLDLNNGCTSEAYKTIDDRRDYPNVNKPNPPNPFVIDCGRDTVHIAPLILGDKSILSYTWETPPEAGVNDLNAPVLITNTTGFYYVSVENKNTGCLSSGMVEVISGTLHAGVKHIPLRGLAPFSVTFTNTSSTSSNQNNIRSIWSFGNGDSAITQMVSSYPEVVYSEPGTYTLHLYAQLGQCYDTLSRIIIVDQPSDLIIPNIFSPNGDGVNDFFYLRSSNIKTLSIRIYDRWGILVYQALDSTKSVFWDGNDRNGKPHAEGVYYYTLEATGADGKLFNKKANITLVR